PRAALARHRIFTGTHQISKRFVVRSRDVDPSKLSRAVQSRQSLGIASVGLDPIPTALRRHRGRHHRALQSLRLQVAVEMESAWPCLVDELQPPPAGLQLLHHAIDRTQIAADRSEVPHLTL